MTDLITRIEAGSGGDEALDLEIIRAVMPDAIVRRADVDEAGKVIPGKAHDYTHWRLTSSLDAAIALTERLLPGWAWSVVKEAGECMANVVPGEQPYAADLDISKFCKEPPRALLVATLRAHEALKAKETSDADA